MADQFLPAPELLRQLLRYEPETGNLYWLERTVEVFPPKSNSSTAKCAFWNRRFSGRVAFTIAQSRGYLSGSIFNQKHLAHRVIWAMHTNAWPEAQIDHINGIKTDNRWKNLRAVDNAENHRNMKLWEASTTGETGVCFEEQTGKWKAQIMVAGKNLHLGRFDKLEDAVAVRRDANKRFGFHENHGRKAT